MAALPVVQHHVDELIDDVFGLFPVVEMDFVGGLDPGRSGVGCTVHEDSVLS